MAVVYLSPESDTYVYNQLPAENFSTAALLYVGFSKPDNIYRSYIKFNLSDIPFPAFINRGILRLFLCTDELNFTKCIDVHRIVSPYDGKTLTYNTQPEFLPNYESSVVLHKEKPQFKEWNITELVRGWHSGGIINNGILLKSRSEKKPSLTAFSSQDCGYSPNVPLLLVEYCNKEIFSVSTTYTATTTPTFTNAFNTFCYKMVSFFIINHGCSDVTASVEVSPDCVNWYEEDNKKTVGSGKTTVLVPYVFGKYNRLKFFAASGSARIEIYLQGQG